MKDISIAITFGCAHVKYPTTRKRFLFLVGDSFASFSGDQTVIGVIKEENLDPGVHCLTYFAHISSLH